MSSDLLSIFRFHFARLLRLQPAGLVLLVAALAVLLSAALTAIVQVRSAQTAAEILEIQQAKVRARPKDETSKDTKAIAAVRLPKFESAQLVAGINRLARETKLPLDEISYALDDSANQPFLRYRVTLSSVATYPVVKRFAGRLNANMPNVVLDAISCAREDIAVVELTCDLVFSATFQKNANG